ncbi:hypothetical protein C8R45DRAFT_948198 [Mycena sanguinolenta]|nr:hypothetical protein C8R45DRAFT_948198 [Mycena sanguinolenta]
MNEIGPGAVLISYHHHLGPPRSQCCERGVATRSGTIKTLIRGELPDIREVEERHCRPRTTWHPSVVAQLAMPTEQPQAQPAAAAESRDGSLTQSTTESSDGVNACHITPRLTTTLHVTTPSPSSTRLQHTLANRNANPPPKAARASEHDDATSNPTVTTTPQPHSEWRTLERERMNAGSPSRRSSRAASRTRTQKPLDQDSGSDNERGRASSQGEHREDTHAEPSWPLEMDVDDGAHPGSPARTNERPPPPQGENRHPPPSQPQDDDSNDGREPPRIQTTTGGAQLPHGYRPEERRRPSPDRAPHGSQTVPPPASPPAPLPRRGPLTEALYLALPPKEQSSNPHRKLRDYEPAPSGLEGLVACISFQINLAPFDAIVLDVQREVRNVDPKFLATMNKKPSEWTLVSFFLGGRLFFDLWKPDHLVDEVTKVLVDAQLADADNIEIIPLPLLKEKGDLYGTSVMAMRVTDWEVRKNLIDINLFGCDPDLTFAIVKYDVTTKTRTLGIWKGSQTKGDDRTAKRFSWTVAEAIITNRAIAKMVERATGGRDNRPLADRLEEFARTVTVRFFPASKHWAAYAKPLTTDPGLWEDIRAAIGVLILDHAEGIIRFEPVTIGNKPPAHPWCQGCKNNDHVRFGCNFVHGGHGDAWWETKATLISEIPKSSGGILTKSPKDARNEAEGIPTGRNTGGPNRGRTRGRPAPRGGRGGSQRR